MMCVCVCQCVRFYNQCANKTMLVGGVNFDCLVTM